MVPNRGPYANQSTFDNRRLGKVIKVDERDDGSVFSTTQSVNKNDTSMDDFMSQVEKANDIAMNNNEQFKGYNKRYGSTDKARYFFLFSKF